MGKRNILKIRKGTKREKEKGRGREKGGQPIENINKAKKKEGRDTVGTWRESEGQGYGRRGGVGGERTRWLMRLID